MSLTQTYVLAHTARGKLAKEAKRGDHNLRRLVGHANLLDGLMIDLLEAERSQEALFNASVKSQSSHTEWATLPTPPSSRQPTIIEDFEEDEDEEDSDSEDEEESPVQSITRRPIITTMEVSQDEDDEQAIDDEEDDYKHLTLTRSPSHSSPPELSLESDDESDEESQPLSPPTPEMPSSFPPVSGDQQKDSGSIPNAFYEEGFYVPQRSRVVVC